MLERTVFSTVSPSVERRRGPTRRGLLAASAAAAVFAPTILRAATPTLRVGYQKYGNLLLLKASGLLEDKLAPLGIRVEWKQFIAGPALMEALGAGAIDVGSAGETPPIFAQAANVPLVYLGAEPPAPRGEAVLVRADSPITDLAGLKGKKVSFNKGSNVHYLFVQAMAKAALAPNEVEPVYLSPADGRAAFERGSVDAWVIWDPFLAAAQASGRTRVLADGIGLAANQQFYLGTRRFGDATVLSAFRDAVAAIDARVTADPDAASRLLAPAIGLPEQVVSVAVKRQSYAVRAMDAGLVADQQRIADTFFKLGLIPKAIKVSDAIA